MKRIAICVFLLACILAGMMNVYASAAQMSVRVLATNENVQVGDTVEFTVLATGQDMVALQFEVRLPEGLSYVPDSAATPEGLAQKLGIPAAEWTEQSMMFTCYNDVGVTVPEGTQLLSFSCVAEKAGDWTVELFDLIPFDSDFQAFAADLQVQTVRVQGTGESKPVKPDGETEPPVTVPEAPEMPTETADELTQPGTVPDQTPEQPDDETGSEPVQPEQSQTPSEPEQSAGLEEGTTPIIQTKPVEKTLNWVWPAVGALIVVFLVAILLILKKKRS